MMSSTLGAPFGGTTRGAHHGVDSDALSLITPPNLGSGGGSCLPVIVVVALGEPDVPGPCCAKTNDAPSAQVAPVTAIASRRLIGFMPAPRFSSPTHLASCRFERPKLWSKRSF